MAIPVTDESLDERILSVIREHPGLMAGGLCHEVNRGGVMDFILETDIAKRLVHLIMSGLVRTTQTGHSADQFWLTGTGGDVEFERDPGANRETSIPNQCAPGDASLSPQGRTSSVATQLSADQLLAMSHVRQHIRDLESEHSLESREMAGHLETVLSMVRSC